MHMIWHIFKKDCVLLWPGICGAAAAHAINAGLWIAVGPFEGSNALAGNAYLASIVAQVSMLMLIAACVHQDTPAATGQDWVVRPLLGRDLILAKVLFAAVAAHGPLLLCDIVEGLVQGFPLDLTVGAALARSTAIFLSLSLPAMLLATLTRNLTGWIGAAMIVLIALILVAFAAGIVAPTRPTYAGTGFGWIAASVAVVLTALAACVALPLRYYLRQTRGVVAIGLAVLILGTFAASLPWKASLAIQHWIAAEPQAGRSITLAVDATSAAPPPNGQWSGSGIAVIDVPLRIAGLPVNSMLMIDNASVRLIDQRGATIYSGENNCIRAAAAAGGYMDCSRQNFRVPAQPSKSEARIWYPIALPAHVYERIQHQPLRLEVDYYLSLLGLSNVGAAPRGCSQRINRDTGEAELRCLNSIATPACIRLLGQAAENGSRFPDVTRCEPNYTPLAFSRFPDVLRRRLERAWFTVGVGAGSRAYDHFYPPNERLVVETYSARNHFARTTSIESVRLADWASLSP
jgi:hypothetical protein